MDSFLLILMIDSKLFSFLQLVVNDHDIASRLKKLSSHPEIVAYANYCGFNITLSEWGRFVSSEYLKMSDEDLELALRADPAHWSWAFKHTSMWRALLMEGAYSKGTLPCPEL